MRLTIPQHQLTLSGNTAGALSNLSSGTVTLAGGNNITLSQVGNAVTISGAAAAGAQTAISGLANSQTTYTSGTVSLSELGGLTIRSSAGQIFQFEIPASSSLSATGAVSISVNGSTISIGAPAQSTQVETQTFIAGISASNTLYTSGTVRITGVGGGVTVSSNTGQRVDISVAAPVAQSVQTQNVVDVTLSGNTAGALALISSGTMSLVGGNNITLSQAGNAVTISGANAGGAQTAISGIVGSDATYTSGTVTFSGVGGGVTVNSNTGQRIDISVAAQSVQPETQTFIAGVSASDTLYTSGNVRISGSQAATVRSGTGQLVIIDVPVQSTQVETQTFIAGVSASDTLYTSGNVRITGVGGGITVSSNTGQRIDLSVAAQSVQPETQTFISGISASNTLYTSGQVRISGSQAVTVRSGTGQLVIIDAPAQTTQVETQTFIAGVSASDTLYTSGNVRITGLGGGITVSSNTGQRIDLSVAAPVAQSTQTQGILSVGVSTGGNTVGNTQVSTGSRFVLVASGNATASQATAAGASTVTISVGTQTVQTQQNIQALYDGANSISTGTVRVTDANGVTFSINAQTLSASVNQSISMFAVSNTTQSTSGTAHKSALSFGGAGVASVGVTGGSVVISVPAGGGAGFSGGVSTGGNTAGATGITGTQNVFVGVTPISLSQTTGANGGTISINAPATSSLSGTGNIQISTNGSTISLGFKNPLADWQNFPMGQGGLMTLVAGISKTPFYYPVELNGYLTAKSLAFKGSMVTANTLLSMSAHLGVYTLVNSTSAALLGSHSEAYVVSSATSVSLSGVRNFIMTGIGTHATLSTLSAGKYVFGMMFSAGASQSMNMSLYGASTAGGPLGGIYPGTNVVSAGTSQGIQALVGRGSTTVNAMPANIQASELVNQGSGASMQLVPWIYIRS